MPEKAPTAVAIHDLSAVGRCSAAVVLPVLSAMGIQCCPLLAAYLSAHSGFPKSDKAVFLDLTPQMAGTIHHWQELGLAFDAVYSGFLGAAEQVDLLCGYLDGLEPRRPYILVDPVMGDRGMAYTSCPPGLRDRMAQLARRAHCITPNLTEAAFLLGESYDRRPAERQGVEDWLLRLSLEGRRSVVLTGVSFREGEVGAACYDSGDGSVHFPMARQTDAHFGGTGDLFASVLLGGVLRGEALSAAAARAVAFVAQAVSYTLTLGTPTAHGVCFEPLLGQLIPPAG